MDKLFKEVLKSEHYFAILCNCMKKLEEKINELFQITPSVKDGEIKGELQLKTVETE